MIPEPAPTDTAWLEVEPHSRRARSRPVVLELLASRRAAVVYAFEVDTLRTALVALTLATDRLLAEFPAGTGGPVVAELRAAVEQARARLSPPTCPPKDPA